MALKELNQVGVLHPFNVARRLIVIHCVFALTGAIMAGNGLIRRVLDKVFFREKHVCPWWLCWTFDNLLRKLVQDPEKIIKPYVRGGSTVLDIGCGMGYFTIPLARLVGEKGQVIATDIQEQMLSALQR